MTMRRITICLFFLLAGWQTSALDIEEKNGNIYIIDDNGNEELVFQSTSDPNNDVSFGIDQISQSGIWAILYSTHTSKDSRFSTTTFLYNIRHKIIAKEYDNLTGGEAFVMIKYGTMEVLELDNGEKIPLSDIKLFEPSDLSQFKLDVYISDNLFTLDIAYLNNNGEYVIDIDDSMSRGEMLGKVDMHISMKHLDSDERYSSKVYSINNPSGLLDDNYLKLDENGNYTISRGGKRAIFFPNSLVKGQYDFQVFLQLANGEKIYSNTINVSLPLPD